MSLGGTTFANSVFPVGGPDWRGGGIWWFGGENRISSL